MLNVIWGFFLIGGILTGAFLGRMDLVTNAVIDGGRNAVELAFTMAGVVAVWSGILKIAEKGGMIDALAEKWSPFWISCFLRCQEDMPQDGISPPILRRTFWGLDGQPRRQGFLLWRNWQSSTAKQDVPAMPCVCFWW